MKLFTRESHYPEAQNTGIIDLKSLNLPLSTCNYSRFLVMYFAIATNCNKHQVYDGFIA